ncbi:MAG: hypothetical protein GVY07_01630, partial [Bacteroidetes bacterium]|nr:hypothetical protein [Bacteroidota bacterium]
MPDPIQVEQSFRELMEQLESTISIRHRYRLFRNFIDNLEDSFLKFESYILQLVDELPEFSEPLTWTGMDPAELELYLAMLDSLNTELQLSEKSQKYSGICNRLREICILLYGCLNDLNGVNFHIKKTLGMSGLSDTDVTGDAQGLDMLRDWISAKL